MKVYVFLAEGFEEIEAIAPIDIFRRAGLETVTVSVTSKKEVTAAHGITVLADELLNETDFADASLLFLPGGMPGTRNLDALPELKEIILAQVNGSKPVAAICAAPLIFGKMGLLNGKEAICYPGFEGELQGATISGAKIVKDGLVHTAQGAGVAVDFALTLVAELKGKEVADQLAKAICLVG